MWNLWPFSRKAEQRSMAIDEWLAMAGIPNTGSGEYVSAGTAESLPAVMNAVSVTFQAEHEDFAFDMSDSHKERLNTFHGI